MVSIELLALPLAAEVAALLGARPYPEPRTKLTTSPTESMVVKKPSGNEAESGMLRRTSCEPAPVLMSSHPKVLR